MLEGLRQGLVERVGSSRYYWLGLAALCVNLIFGGGSRQWLPSEFVCQVCGVVFLAAAAAHLSACRDIRRLSPELFLALVFLAIPVIQLVPLPPFIWSVLPGRSSLVTEFQLAQGSLPWQPISLSPSATYQALFSLCGPLAVFILTLTMTFEERRSISIFLLAFGLLSAVLALLQLMQGPDSPLRFYAITNPELPVGFFANRNHFAALLYSLLPLAAAWIVGLGVKIRKSRRKREIDHKRLFLYLVAVGVFVVFLFLQGLIHSRAGLAVTAVGAAASVCLALPFRKNELGAKAIKWLFGALIVAVVLMGYYAAYRIIQQFDRDPVDDARFAIWGGALKALWAFFPTGSGFGAFDTVYRAFELPGTATSEYINRAHNDVLEVLIEGGAFSLVAIVLFVAWLVRAFWNTWSSAYREIPVLDASLARAGALVPVLLMMHSFLDYPLRTDAVMSLFAFSCALTVWPLRESPERAAGRGRAHRSHRMRVEDAVGGAAA